MSTTNQADATARALDLLPADDSARSDPRLLRDAALAEEARLTRETAAAVWLAVSPLHVAPPQVLRAVMAEIRPLASPSTRKPRYLTWLAASGWAAAAAVAISLWPKPAATVSPRVGETTAREPQSEREISKKTAPVTIPTPRDARLREEVIQLQKRLAAFRDDQLHRAPRVMSLSAPGAVRRTPEEARQHVQSVLTNALRSALEASSAAPSDAASLVIERGWLPGGLPLPEDGGVIRHRNFPEQAWQELGLSRSSNGEYYDAASSTVWSADPEGRGFIGKKIAAEDDVARFTKEPDQEAPPKKSRPAPEGFIIENPVDNRTEIFVENVPPLPEGRQFVVRVTDAAGTITEVPLPQTATPAVQETQLDEIASNSPAATETIPDVGQIAANAGDPVPFVASPSTVHATSPVLIGRFFGGGTTFLTDGTIVRNPVSTGATNTSFFPSGNGVSVMNASLTPYGGISGFLNGPPLWFGSSGALPASFQLLESSLISTGEPPKVILQSGP